MILYIDSREAPDLENIPPQVIRYCVQKAEAAAGRYDRLYRYYRGEHDILRIKPGANETKVIINYAKYVADIITGYYLGEAIKYDANDRGDRVMGAEGSDDGNDRIMPDLSGEAAEEIDISPLIDCYDAQQIGRVDLEIGKKMGIMGDCLELCYASTDESPIPRSACIDPRNGILVCDSTVEHKKLFGIVWERRERVTGEKYYFVTVYTEATEIDYESTDLKNAVFHERDRRPHYFQAVPVIAYENNAERQGDFEQVMSLINAYDELMSNRLTDKKKFVDAVLAFFGFGLVEGEDKKLAEYKFIDNIPTDARVEYIQKTFDEAGVQVLADSIVREIHKMTMTVDMTDEKFAGNASGQALKLKLFAMGLLVKSKTRQMEKGLKERFTLYNQWLCTKAAMKPVGVNDVDVVFTTSLPINEKEVVEIVKELQGIVDSQTLLSLLWFVRDPVEAAENLKKEKTENMAAFQKTIGTPNDAQEESAEDDAEENEQKARIGFGVNDDE